MRTLANAVLFFFFWRVEVGMCVFFSSFSFSALIWTCILPLFRSVLLATTPTCSNRERKEMERGESIEGRKRRTENYRPGCCNNCHHLQGPALFSGFTRLCKGLAAVLVLGYVISQIFPSAIDYLALVPGKTVPFAWNLVTAGYLEQSIFGLIVNIAGLFFSGKLLQPIWGAKEFLKFIAIVNFFVSFSTFILAVLLFYVTGREIFLYMPLSGFHGVLSGFLVGMKQIMPDQEATTLGAYVIRAKWLPSLLVLLSVIISFLTTESMPFLPFVIFGTYGSWLYLRYFQRNPDTHLKGYPTEDFAFSTFFPSFMRPILDTFATMCQKIFCQNAPVSSEVGDMYAAGGVYVPGSDPLEASRRRERGARALDERLGTANSEEVVGEHLPQDASNNV